MADETRKPTESETQAFGDHFRAVMRDERGVTLKCSLCGADDWYAFGDVGVHILEGRDPATGEVQGIPGSVHVLAASCRKCGLISMFDRDVVGG